MDDIHTIKPPIETSIINQNLIHLIWIFLIILVLIIILLLYYFLRKKGLLKKKNNINIEKEELSIDYKKIAEEKIKKAKKEIELSEYKSFYLQATEIIKEFLSYSYSENFLDMTTREILKSKKLSNQVRINLEKLLKQSDLAKFAGKNKKKENALKVFDLALLIIEKDAFSRS